MNAVRDIGDKEASSTLSFSTVAEFEGDSLQAAEESEQLHHFVRPVEETRPASPQDPHQRLLQLMRSGREQNASIASQVSNALARNLTRLQSLEEQLDEIEAQLHNLQLLFSSNSASPIASNISTTIPQQETTLGASGPYTMVGSRHVFYEARPHPIRTTSTIARALRQSLANMEDQMSQPHKQGQPFTRIPQCQGFMLGIQYHPMLVQSSGIRTVALPTAHGRGVVWIVLLSSNQHVLREELVITTVYSTLMACPRCNCQMQLGCQFKLERTRAGTTVSLKKLYIVRVSVHLSGQLSRYIQAQVGELDVCEPQPFYVLVKIQIGDTVSEEIHWKVTV